MSDEERIDIYSEKLIDKLLQMIADDINEKRN